MRRYHHLRRETMKMRLFACATVAVGLFAVGMLAWSNQVNKVNRMPALAILPDSPEEIARQQAEEAEYEKVRGGGEFYKPLRMVVDYPGVEAPKLLAVDSANLPASTQIVGVEVDGEFCAFVLNSMLNPRHHIVNMMLNERPLSVTYCDLVDCVRVLTNDDKKPISLHVGGLDVDNQMVFLLGDKRYGQSSNGLPLLDHPFDRMTLGEWKDLHPTTKLYVGPNG